ncbi:MAG: NADP-dependent oxidoreductase [Beggiatoa sp.]|nr:NADP-dependent oxidoreductase [Beggiatoa sp.]
METMKAVRIHSYGGPEVLKYEEAPRPKSAPGEVLIRVHAAGVNPVDWKIRQGYFKGRVDYSLPLILGWDLSGVVEAAGSSVAGLQEGDEVYSRPDIARNGAYAEHIVVREKEVALKPKSIDHIHAAAIPLAALTAWQSLFDVAGLSAGQKVLIHAAAGGVGSFAVQLAKWKGAYVIGTASKHNHELVRNLGADETIDYQTTRFEDGVHDVDVVFDTIGGDTQKRSWKVLKKDGILVSILGPPSAEEAAAHGVRQAAVFVQPSAVQLTELAKLVDSGRLRPIVETVLPLSEARHAHELSQTGHTRGKIVLRVV